jgi:hypothetical protein
VVRGGYMQEPLDVSRMASKLLVNGRSNKMVNIASTKIMKKIFCVMKRANDEAIQFLLELWIASRS